MKRTLFGALALLALVACKGEEYQAARVVAAAGGEAITVEAKTIDDTSIAFAARAVGLDFKRGAVLSLKIGSRPTLVLQSLSDAKRAPTKEEVDALVAGVKTKRSSDGQHLLVSWKLDDERLELFHLLPGGGPPFQLDQPGLQGALSLDMDLGKLPRSETLALKALTVAARSPDCAIIGQHLFWEALQDGAGGTGLEKPLLALWPKCSDTWIPVVNMARNSKAVSAEWKAALKAKRNAIIEAGQPIDHLRLVLDMCLFIEDQACTETAATKLAPAWPADDGVHRVFMGSFDKLPQALRDAVFEKAMGDHSKYSFEEAARLTRFMRAWATCEQYKAYGQAHLGVPQEREGCSGWPLKRFPEEGAEMSQLRDLLVAKDRNGSIRLVRKTTGWEDMKAVEFVDAQAAQQKATAE